MTSYARTNAFIVIAAIQVDMYVLNSQNILHYVSSWKLLPIDDTAIHDLTLEGGTGREEGCM